MKLFAVTLGIDASEFQLTTQFTGHVTTLFARDMGGSLMSLSMETLLLFAIRTHA